MVEVDGRDVTNFDVKAIKEMTKGPPGSPMKLKAKRGANGAVYEVVLERSGGSGSSMASISDASSMQGNASGVESRELTASERGTEGSEAAMVLHEELDKLRASLATMTAELAKAKLEVLTKSNEVEQVSKEAEQVSKSTEVIKKELAASSTKLAEYARKAAELQAQLEETNAKLAMAAKSGDERVIALEKAHKETEDFMKEQKGMSEKQAWDLEEAQTALRALHR